MYSTKVFGSGWAFLASKTLHLGGYAFLAGTAGLLAGTGRYRLGLWLLLVGHAGLTEYLQTFVEGRFGSVQDVVINLIGITLGVALALGWRLRPVFRPQGRPFSATTTPT